MKKSLFFLCCLASQFCLRAQTTSDKIMLPNGWALSPAGTSLKLGDFPLNMAVSSSGKYMAVTNNGVSNQCLQLIDAKNKTLVCTKRIPKAWLGLKFSKDEYLYASGGNDNRVMKYRVMPDTLLAVDSIITKKQRFAKYSSTAGLDINDETKRLYVVGKEDSTLYIIDLNTDKVIKHIQLDAEPYTCLLSHDGKTLFISLWGGSAITVFNTDAETVTDLIPAGHNPNDMCITKDGKYLFVANAIDNSVSVIDIAKHREIETLNAALYPYALNGSTTNSLALSTDEKTLYIANADNNCLAVFDVSNPGKCSSKGFVPVGWYPTCVRVHGHNIYVTNGKGMSSLPNPEGPQPVKKTEVTGYKKADDRNEQYIGSLFKGTLSFIHEPNEKELAAYSKQVYSNTPYTKDKEQKAEGEKDNPIPTKVGGKSPIKHVFYIIKENRTYDQVLSDIPEGNGDQNLLLFGKKYTPNEHELAKQFVLLDNFYVDGEVSADGHNWSTAAYANDYIEKTWPTDYGSRGSGFKYHGKRTIGLPRNGMFIWDYAFLAGLSFRNYGEFDDDDGRKTMKGFNAHTCDRYPGWGLHILDTTRERIWEEDFDSLIAKDAVPQLNVIYLPDDHTAGLSTGNYSPFALVAGNDLAVGKLIEHLSNSKVWNSSAVFILEDDAQNGPDHVDAHRTTAFLAGPFVKRNFVDHTMYSTTGMLRTMELILGLPPMSQYDAAATPMWRSFTKTPDNTPYTHIDESVLLTEKNLAVNELSKKSEEFDFAEADRAPDLELNQVLWASIKGMQVPFPGPKRAAFVALHQKDNDDK